MFIYHLKRVGKATFDENDEGIVRASTPARARVLMSAEAADEGKAVWTNKKKSKCRVIGMALPSHSGTTSEKVLLVSNIGG